MRVYVYIYIYIYTYTHTLNYHNSNSLYEQYQMNLAFFVKSEFIAE